MTMAFFRTDGVDPLDLSELRLETPTSSSGSGSTPVRVPIIRSKLAIPNIGATISRQWLLGVLERSSQNASATIIIGRAGSGKTCLAAEHARSVAGAAWYSIDAGDADWNSFQSYFRESLLSKARINAKNKRGGGWHNSPTPLELIADVTAEMELASLDWPTLLVLDGIHHLYDCGWFPEFFSLVIASLPHTSHLLLISRSKPPTPVWRLRSKQVLNVVDEKLLAFSQAEAEELFDLNGLGKADGRAAHARSFGRAGALAEIISRNEVAGAR